MNTRIILLLLALTSCLLLVACAPKDTIIVNLAPLPGNNTLQVAHECNETICGTFIDTQETQ